MMTRLCGVLCLAASGLLASYLAAREQKRRLTVLDGWVTLIRHMRGEIDCFLTPSEEILKASGSVLLSFCHGEDVTFSSLLENTSHYLNTESRRVLSEFLQKSGALYREEQIKRCDYCLSGLLKERERVFAALPGAVRVSVALSLAIPMGAAILLW